MFEAERTEVKTDAQRERERLARQARAATASIETETEAVREQLAQQATQARAGVASQVEEAKGKATAEARGYQAEIRGIQSQAEREAEEAKGKARQAHRVELRKRDLPISKPRVLDIRGYIGDVNKARIKAHAEGKDVRDTIERVRTEYFAEVDREETKALTAIAKEERGIQADISKALAVAKADITKQLLNLSSGVRAWEADSLSKINKAEAEYQAVVTKALNKPGEEVFAELQAAGVITDKTAQYQSYDRVTGQLTYTTIEMVAEPTTDISEPTKVPVTVPVSPQVNTSPGLAALGAIALSPTWGTAVRAATFSPDPISKIILATMALGVFATVAGRELGEWIKSKIDKAKDASSDMVITNDTGTRASTVSPFVLVERRKGATILTDPYTQPLPSDIKDPLTDVKPLELKLILESKPFQLKGIPLEERHTMVIIRDPFDEPELRQKGSKMLIAALGVSQSSASVVKELGITRQQWEVVEEAFRQGKIATGKRILEGMADKAGTSRLAFEDYLRKRAILEAARKSYVASLNPQPISGKGSTDAKAAAVGIWFVLDNLRNAITEALRKGQSIEGAIKSASDQIQEVAKVIGLTTRQINVATTTVLYEAGIQSMVQQALKTVELAKTEGLTKTELQQRVMTQTKIAVQTMTQQAISTRTLTKTQAQTMARSLRAVASTVATMALKLKLPKRKGKEEPEGKYPAGSVAWKQGFIYKLKIPGDNEVKNSTKPFPGVKTLSGIGSAYRTIVRLGGEVPQSMKIDMGIMDVEIKTGKEGKGLPKLRFLPDPGQRTHLTPRRFRHPRPRQPRRATPSLSAGR